MAVVRNNSDTASTGGLGNGTTWTRTISFTPTAGRCLLMYIQCLNALSITSITQGGSSATWSLITSSAVANNNIYVYALPNVPSGSNTTVTMVLSAGTSNFTTIIEEVSGLVTTAGSLLDKSSTTSGSGNTYQTGTTASTVTDNEYWVNIYSWYDVTTAGGPPSGSGATNSYTLFSSTPVQAGATGWTGGAGLPSAQNCGQFMAYRIVSTTGTAGGNITDSNANGYAYNGLAIALAGTADTVVVRRRVVPVTMF
jgi:hypothetical protein